MTWIGIFWKQSTSGPSFWFLRARGHSNRPQGAQVASQRIPMHGCRLVVANSGRLSHGSSLPERKSIPWSEHLYLTIIHGVLVLEMVSLRPAFPVHHGIIVPLLRKGRIGVEQGLLNRSSAFSLFFWSEDQCDPRQLRICASGRRLLRSYPALAFTFLRAFFAKTAS